MSEPNPPQIPEMQPGGRPFTGEPKKMPRGCGRPVLIGCGVIAVLVGIAAIVFVAKAKDLLAWTMHQLESQVEEALPADVTAAERARLERGFSAALDRIRTDQVEPPALFALQRQLTSAAEKAQQKKLTRDDVLDLLSALERVGGLLPKDDDAAAEGATGEAAAAPGEGDVSPPEGVADSP